MGTFKMSYIRLSSNVSGLANVEKRTWVVTPKCDQGACDIEVQSYYRKPPSPHWTKVGLLTKGGYAFSRNDSQAFTCGSGGNISYYIPAVYSYTFAVTKMALIGGEWVATQVQGELNSRGTRGCGLSGPPEEKEAIRGTLVAGTVVLPAPSPSASLSPKPSPSP